MTLATMKRLFLRWVLLALSVIGAALVTQTLDLGFKVDFLERRDATEFLKLLLGVIVLGLLNATLGKILKLLTLPLSCLTLGLFSLIVNAVVFWVAASLGLGFSITRSGFMGFVAALVASLLVSAINGALGVFLPDDKED